MHDGPRKSPLGTPLMALAPFAASLQKAAAQHPPSKCRRIAALLPEIEAAFAQGSTRAHVVSALMGVGIEVSPHQLTNVIARLRKQAVGATERRVPGQTAGSSGENLGTVAAGVAPSPQRHGAQVPGSAGPQVTGVPTLVPPPRPDPAPRFGVHDPRLLDEVMRSTPDMKALAKLAPRSKP